MGITPAAFERHSEYCQQKFKDYRAFWYRGLYRHEPLENAVKILQSGSLLSREVAEARNAIVNDIAPDEIISNTSVAHSSVRLYFRPRNPTQFHVEGIRSPDEYYQGKHGGFLVLFIFDASVILTSSDTKFSDGNLQSPESSVIDGDNQFYGLDFNNIYHDGSLPADVELKQAITRQKCSEVIINSSLNLDTQILKRLFVRTDADVATLKCLLSSNGCDNYADLVKKSPDNRFFFNFYNALSYIESTPNLIQFSLKRTKTSREVNFKLEIAKTHLSKLF